MVIKRERYLRQLIAKKWNGKIKTIIEILRRGKSFHKLYQFHMRRILLRYNDNTRMGSFHVPSEDFVKILGIISDSH